MTETEQRSTVCNYEGIERVGRGFLKVLLIYEIDRDRDVSCIYFKLTIAKLVVARKYHRKKYLFYLQSDDFSCELR